MEQELAYYFHLGSDKNKSNKHNLRDYDNKKDLIRTIYGINNIVKDVKKLYLDEFEQAKNKYNNKQTRNDRKIDNYFHKVCASPNDIHFDKTSPHLHIVGVPIIENCSRGKSKLEKQNYLQKSHLLK